MRKIILVGISGKKYQFEVYAIDFNPDIGPCIYIPSGFGAGLISHQHIDETENLQDILAVVRKTSFKSNLFPNCICVYPEICSNKRKEIINDLKSTPYFN